MYEQDTIAAIATPPGEGGVAIVRISGVDAEKVAGEIFARAGGNNGKLKSHVLYHGKIRDPKNHHVIDEVLLTVMRQPRSYTGEDIVEVHCHGGDFLARHILGLVLRQGARQAEPGEFTKRAFLNGKLDLAQAEAVLDLIRARTAEAAELALNQASGELSKHVGGLREELLNLFVQIEAAIDFPEEDVELLQRRQLIANLNALRHKINVISKSYEWGRLFREGARVAICGRPNVGKSSLLNALLGEQRVIVTPIPGTTRDVIEESITLDGLPVVLWDTAGIRETEDYIEQLGVELSRQHLAKADAIIVVLDGSACLIREDLAVLQLAGEKKCLVAINKSDLPNKLSMEQISVGKRSRIVSISARTGEGLSFLKAEIRKMMLDDRIVPDVIVTNIRHHSELSRCENALAHAVSTLNQNLPPELAAVDLNDARQALEEIIGVVCNDDVLERIFKQFCIGK